MDAVENKPPGLGSNWMQGTQERGPGHDGVVVEMDRTTLWTFLPTPTISIHPNTGEEHKRLWTDVC